MKRCDRRLISVESAEYGIDQRIRFWEQGRMTRLVNVSNRLPVSNTSSAPGGLVTGVFSAMRSGGGVWFGCEGASEDSASDAVDITAEGPITFAKISLPRSLFNRYYDGSANGTLWPLMHSFLDGFRYREEEHEAYKSVNELFARRLQPLLRGGDLVWVHDYHLFHLAHCLRAAWQSRFVNTLSTTAARQTVKCN
jgi:trehalose 6-phosphate synthase